MTTFFTCSALPVRIWAEAAAACSFPPYICDVLSESYDIMWNEGHVWALTQGTFIWPGPDHRENILNATPSSSFYSSSRCPRKMLKALLGEKKKSPFSFSRELLQPHWPQRNSEMKKCSHGKTPPNGKMNLTFDLLPVLQLQLCKHIRDPGYTSCQCCAVQQSVNLTALTACCYCITTTQCCYFMFWYVAPLTTYLPITKWVRFQHPGCQLPLLLMFQITNVPSY